MKRGQRVFFGIVFLTFLVGFAIASPVADFNATPEWGAYPLTVQFFDKSYGGNLTQWAWDFENDGIIDSTESYPVHTYTAPGNYSVKMTVYDEYGWNSTLIRESYIIAYVPPMPYALFTATPKSGYNPLTVQFTDQSIGTMIHSWAWDLNSDGITDSTLQNPTYTYAVPGTYSVNLTVTDIYGVDNEFRIGYITVSSVPAPVANFSATPRTGTAPLAVQFTDLSSGSGIASWAWDFENDGTVDSTAQNPLFTYPAAGTYAVSLTVTNPGGSHREIKTGYVTVTAPAKPVAQFTATPTSGKKPLTVRFTDQSTGAGITSWAWDFNNDGTIDSRVQNPSFTYTSAGYYSVKLTATNAGGSNSKTRYFYINVKR